MENASKALLIAGAILIVILIIGVGMMVFQGAQGAIGTGVGQMSEQEQQMFNTKFTQYAGERTSGSNVRALIENIISSNNANKEIEGRLVKITGDSSIEPAQEDIKSNEMSAYRAKINTGATYSVVTKYGDGGLVNEVEIKKNTNK